MRVGQRLTAAWRAGGFAAPLVPALAVVAALGIAGPACETQNPPNLFDDGDAAGEVDASAEVGVDAGPLLFEVSDNGMVDFGLVDCGGTAPAPKKISFKNVGPVPIVYHATLDSTLAFVISAGATGVVSQGISATVTLLAQPISGSAKAGETIHATLILSDSYGHTPLNIPISITPQGGALTVSPAMGSFSTTPFDTQATDLPLVVSNVGNKAVLVTIAQPMDTDLSVTWTGAPGPVMVEPGKMLPGAAVRFRPTAAGPHMGEAGFIPSGALCNGGEQKLPLTGKGGPWDAGDVPDAGDAGPGDAAPGDAAPGDASHDGPG